MPKWKVTFTNESGVTTSEQVEADFVTDKHEGWVDFADGSKASPQLVLRLRKEKVFRIDLQKDA